MNLEHIRERLLGGFRPFKIQLSNGRSFVVPHPEFIAIGRSVLVLYGKNDTKTKIDALHIASAEDFQPKRRR